MKHFSRKKMALGMAILTLIFWGGVNLLQQTRFPYDAYLRLHVLANSDQSYDQRLKLAVRDEMISVLTPMLMGAKNADEACQLTEAHLAELTEAAQQVVWRNGYDYPVTAEVGTFDFPDRQYDQLFLPAGNYQALRVRIGEAAGHNWWCVLYPPLCLTSDGNTLTAVPQESPQTRFFLVDLWEKLHHDEENAPPFQKTEDLGKGDVSKIE